jgi:hypothetical protein
MMKPPQGEITPVKAHGRRAARSIGLFGLGVAIGEESRRTPHISDLTHGKLD